MRVNRLFADFYGRNDAMMYRVSQQVLRGEHAWLESGIISLLDGAEHEGEAEEEQRVTVGASAG